MFILYLALVLFGTVLRFSWMNKAQPWLGSVDNIAWLTVLNAPTAERELDQLIHYPHEVASLGYSALALLLPVEVGDWPNLNIISLVADSALRLGMIIWAGVVFSRRVAIIFGIWLIGAVPLLIEWAVIPHGMHANAAIWPILGLALIHHRDKLNGYLVGFLSALALLASFDNIPLILWGLIFMLFHAPNRLLQFGKWLLAFVLASLPLLYLQIFGDLGFDLLAREPFWIRGLSLNPANIIASLPNLLFVWLAPIPGASLLPGIPWRLVWAALVYVGLIVGLVKDRSIETRWGTLFLVGYSAVYALSPTYEPSVAHTTAIAYRHLAYILPLLVLLALNGFWRLPRLWRYSLATAVILLGIGGGLARFQDTSPPEHMPIEPVGVVLAWKYGHDTPRLLALVETADIAQTDLFWQGVGGGYATIFLDRGDVEGLLAKIGEYPPEHQPALRQGIRNAFAPGRTPVLDPRWLDEFEAR